MQESAGTNKHGGPIAWMTEHPVSANLFMLLLIAGGIYCAFSIKKEIFPDFDLDRIVITIPYPGAGPEEVEKGIILAIEDAISGFEGISKVLATADEGLATVTVEVSEGEDVQRLARDIEQAVDRITSFPEEAEDPRVSVPEISRYVVSLVLYGKKSDWTLRQTAEEIKDRLLDDEGISNISLAGIRDYEIAVEIPQRMLRAYSLTIEDVARIIRNEAVEVPAGAIKTKAGDILVRVKERRDWGKEFAMIPVVANKSGSVVLLKDIARITDDFEQTESFATYNGYPAVLIEVHRVGDQTPTGVASSVKRRLVQIRKELPPGMSVDIRNDRSEIFRQRLDLMTRNGLFGLVLVLLLMGIFLEARLAFWVCLGIPVSFLGSMLILKGLGISINMVTMFAFIVTLGIVVDDAIVVGENIYSKRQQGYGWFEAAKAGASSISVPVVFSVLTNMVAFVPMFFVPGFLGKVFRQIPVVVISVFAISLIESLLILPAHIGHQKERSTGIFAGLLRIQSRFSNLFPKLVGKFYRPFLAFVIRWRYPVIACGVGVLILSTSFVKSGRLGFELFPRIESDYSLATVVLPFGSPVEQAKEVQKRLVETAAKVAASNGGEELVEGIFARVHSNRVTIRAYLTPPGRRPISTAEFTRQWRRSAGRIFGAESVRFESDAGGPGRGPAITVELSHRNMETLKKASSELAGAFSLFPIVTDVDDGFSPGKEQIDIRLTPLARAEGLTPADVARQVRNAFYGSEALTGQRGRSEFKVMVRLAEEQRSRVNFLNDLVLKSPSGKEIPFREAARTRAGRAYTSIERRDGRRVVTVTADVRPRSRAGEVLAAIKADVLPELKNRFPGLGYSFEGRQADRRKSMESLAKGLYVALVVIFAMLAVILDSFIQPAIILVAVPFGIVGAVVGHMVMGYSLSVMSMFGVVALSGVVINGSLVLVDFANRLKKKGLAAADLIVEAGVMRFRPVLLTTLTTFGGLAPMIFETSRQAKFLIPMAVSLGYGILFGTLITLVLVPCLFMVVEDLRRLRGLG